MSELSIAEILKRVQRVQIVANRTVDDLFAGQYKSVFRGRGMEFDEIREYQPGDDIRTIDWNVTARTGDCYIKRFCEERELTVLFLADVSASGAFGTTHQSKLELVIELVAMLMFSALKNNDKIGLIQFCDDVIEFFPPRKGKAHVLRLIRELVDTQPVPRPTNLGSALEFLNRVQKRKAVVFLISDFLGAPADKQLAVANRRHDLTAISISDPREQELPNVGFVRFRDAETGEIVEIDTARRKVRDEFRRNAQQRSRRLAASLQRLGVDQLDVDTQGNYLRTLRAFFQRRA